LKNKELTETAFSLRFFALFFAYFAVNSADFLIAKYAKKSAKGAKE
jgi:hypothetical protein